MTDPRECLLDRRSFPANERLAARSCGPAVSSRSVGRGPGRLLASSPASPQCSFGSGARRASSARNTRHREPPMPSGAGVQEGSSFRVCPSRRAGIRRNAARRFNSGGLPAGNGEQLKATAVCSARGHRCTVRSSIATERSGTLLMLFRVSEVKSPRHIEAVAGRVGFVPTRPASVLLDALWSARAAEVDALVSTPLRPRRLDPGSRRLQRRCSPSPGKVAETLECVCPLRVGSRPLRPSRPARQGLRDGPTASGGIRGSIVAALSKRMLQTWHEMAGPHLKSSAGASFGTRRSSATSAPPLQPLVALWRTRYFPAARV